MYLMYLHIINFIVASSYLSLAVSGQAFCHLFAVSRALWIRWLEKSFSCFFFFKWSTGPQTIHPIIKFKVIGSHDPPNLCSTEFEYLNCIQLCGRNNSLVCTPPGYVLLSFSCFKLNHSIDETNCVRVKRV